MNIRCQQSSNIPTDYTIPASQLTQTARNLEVLIDDYQEGIWASIWISHDKIVGCTMTEALRQAKNVGDIRGNAECSADNSPVSRTTGSSPDCCDQPSYSRWIQHWSCSNRQLLGSAFAVRKLDSSSEQFGRSGWVATYREDEATASKARDKAQK